MIKSANTVQVGTVIKMPDNQFVKVYQIYPNYYLVYPIQSIDQEEVINMNDIPGKGFTINMKYMKREE